MLRPTPSPFGITRSSEMASPSLPRTLPLMPDSLESDDDDRQQQQQQRCGQPRVPPPTPVWESILGNDGDNVIDCLFYRLQSMSLQPGDANGDSSSSGDEDSSATTSSTGTTARNRRRRRRRRHRTDAVAAAARAAEAAVTSGVKRYKTSSTTSYRQRSSNRRRREGGAGKAEEERGTDLIGVTVERRSIAKAVLPAADVQHAIDTCDCNESDGDFSVSSLSCCCCWSGDDGVLLCSQDQEGDGGCTAAAPATTGAAGDYAENCK